VQSAHGEDVEGSRSLAGPATRPARARRAPPGAWRPRGRARPPCPRARSRRRAQAHGAVIHDARETGGPRPRRDDQTRRLDRAAQIDAARTQGMVGVARPGVSREGPAGAGGTRRGRGRLAGARRVGGGRRRAAAAGARAAAACRKGRRFAGTHLPGGARVPSASPRVRAGPVLDGASPASGRSGIQAAIRAARVQHLAGGQAKAGQCCGRQQERTPAPGDRAAPRSEARAQERAQPHAKRREWKGLADGPRRRAGPGKAASAGRRAACKRGRPRRRDARGFYQAVRGGHRADAAGPSRRARAPRGQEHRSVIGSGRAPGARSTRRSPAPGRPRRRARRGGDRSSSSRVTAGDARSRAGQGPSQPPRQGSLHPCLRRRGARRPPGRGPAQEDARERPLPRPARTPRRGCHEARPRSSPPRLRARAAASSSRLEHEGHRHAARAPVRHPGPVARDRTEGRPDAPCQRVLHRPGVGSGRPERSNRGA
jgi:hypothetical protein